MFDLVLVSLFLTGLPGGAGGYAIGRLSVRRPLRGVVVVLAAILVVSGVLWWLVVTAESDPQTPILVGIVVWLIFANTIGSLLGFSLALGRRAHSPSAGDA
jgi:predicted MFS family arabinose efflux permease